MNTEHDITIDDAQQINTAESIINKLKMSPLPLEGGHFIRTYESLQSLELNSEQGKIHRKAATAIYYLLKNQQHSAFHVLTSEEMWHFYAGDPITLVMIDDAGRCNQIRIGPDVLADEHPQWLVQPGVHFAAYIKEEDKNLGYSLIGCTVSPGFEFEDFRLSEKSYLLSLCPQAQTLIEQLCE